MPSLDILAFTLKDIRIHSYMHAHLYSLPQNQEFSSKALSEEIKAKLEALAGSRRAVGDSSLAVSTLGALPPSAKKDPLADMTTTVSGVATGACWSSLALRVTALGATF